LLPGEVSALDARGGRLPHIGWSLVRFTGESPLTAGLPEACAFYHVHSFVARPAEPDDVLGVAEHGERFASVVARERLFGVQFHPEKSSTHGLRLLENFAALCARVAA
jgi:glutamine amidotransferase